jgi:hypothetical protein
MSLDRQLTTIAIVLVVLSIPSLLAWIALTYVFLLVTGHTWFIEPNLDGMWILMFIALGWWGWAALFWSVPKISTFNGFRIPVWARFGFVFAALIPMVTFFYSANFSRIHADKFFDAFFLFMFIYGGAPVLVVLILCAKRYQSRR